MTRAILALAALIFLGISAQAANTVAVGTTSAATVTPVVSTALESSRVLKSSAGNLYGFQVNFGTCAVAPCWILVFNATSLPADGAVTPIKFYQVGANTTTGVSWAPGPPLRFGTGVVVGCSTTGPFTQTATAQCTISGEVQ